MTSTYWVCLLLLIPLIGGMVHWRKSEKVTWQEWVGGFSAAILILVAVFWISSSLQGSDTEIRSGSVYQACHTPWWRAEWEEWVPPETDSEGKVTRSGYWETQSEVHEPDWWVETDIGRIDVNRGTFDEIVATHGIYKQEGERTNYDEGDRYDYFSDVDDDPALPQYPVHAKFKWDNPLQGTETILLGPEIPEEEAQELGLFPYPEPDNHFESNRVIDAPVSSYLWDQMCAVLGPTKKVNLTLINFGDKSLELAVKQRDYWRNGEKNDLVLCYGSDWAYVFGWSKSELVKRQLESVLLENEVSDKIVPKIWEVVREDFEPYEWIQHDGTPRPVGSGTVWLAFLLMIVSQACLHFWFSKNDIAKNSGNVRRARFGRMHTWR